MIIAVIIAALLLIYCVTVFVLFKMMIGRCDRFTDLFNDDEIERYHFGENLKYIRQGARFVLDSKPEEIYLTGFDGVRLYARLIEATESKGTIILFHGFRSYTEFDFSSVIEKYHNMGFSVLLVTQRAHGKSGGKYICFGIKERRDCVTWAEYISDRFGKDVPIVLEGLSMGATTVLMASALPLPENVCAVVADCGFTSPDAIISHVAKNMMHVPRLLVIPITRLYFKIFTGCGTKDASTLDALKTTKLPVLFIHGEADTFVPYSMGIENNNAYNSPHVFVSVPDAEHGRSYLVDREKCDKALDGFFKTYVK